MPMRRDSGPIAAALLSLAPGVLAHDGHGDAQWLGSLLHYLIEPAHLLPALAVLVLLVVARWRVSDPLPQRADAGASPSGGGASAGGPSAAGP